MEPKYTVKQLDFSPSGEFKYPHATVLVQLEPCPTMVVPAIRLQIRITSAAAAEGLPAIAASALAEARQLLPAPAALSHLQALLAEEQRLEQEQKTRDAAALQASLGGVQPPSGG